jgi:serine/threonine protein kinase
MSQNDLYGSASSTRTMTGLGLPKEARLAGATSAAQGSPEWFVRLFDWAGGLGAVVVREFTRQALGVARLRHPHVVQLVDAGSAPDGTPFVIMERLAGATLEERAGGTLIPLPELLPILRGMASGLAAAHTAGITHLELRADNVFMADVLGYSYGFPKLLGFGVSALTAAACARGHEVAALSSDAVPPEQRLGVWRGDARSDQYALAALAYRFLAVADLTPAIELVLTRAMAWHPEGRFDSMTSFIEALEAAVQAGPQAPPPAKADPEECPAAPALEAGSLTQQFFAEGDRLEAAIEDELHGGDSRATPASADAADTTLSVPHSRAPMIAAVSLALVSLVIVGWTAVSLSDAPRWQKPPSVEESQSPPGAAPARPALAPTRTASMALRAPQPAKVAARPSHHPTQPPPVARPATTALVAPAPATALQPAAPATSSPAAALVAVPPAPTEAAKTAETATVATTPTAPLPTPAAEPAAPATDPTAPPIDEAAAQPLEQPGGGPVDEPQAAAP